MFSPQHERVLAKLGQDISLARRRRRMSQSSVAQRSGVSLSTIRRLENGDEGIALGALLRVLAVFGLQEHMATLADASHDQTGLALIHAALPSRQHNPTPRKVRPLIRESSVEPEAM